MMREVARLLSTDSNAPYSRAADFIAYAIDWELEFDAFRQILTECGASTAAVESWKRRGWLKE
jgi:hypothetical protein